MIELVLPNETPPGGWRWKHPDTGAMIYGAHFGALVDNARSFLKNNNYPPIREIEDLILEWMDEDIQAKAHAKGLPPVPFIRRAEGPTMAQQARQFAYSMGQWVKSGMKVVPKETFDERLALCETCHYWRGASAYGFGRCNKCGCSGVKLYLTTSRCPLNPPRW
jgi:hypothetical protein